MGEQLKLLIKRAIDVIQSLLILIPPLVVDCSPHPDMKSGAYGEKVVGFTSADYVTTQSALFYSYKEESVAKYGECLSTASIRKDLFPGFISGAPIPKQYSALSIIQRLDKETQTDYDVDYATTQTTRPRKLISTRVITPQRKNVYRTEEQNAIPTRSVKYSQKQEVTSPELLEIKQELQPLVAEIQEMKHVVLLSSDGYQNKSDEQYQQIQESSKRQQQQLQEFHKREVQQLQDSIGRRQQQLEERQHQQLQESDERQQQQLQDFNERQAQQLQDSTNRQLKQLEMSHERHQQQLQESNERQQQQLQESHERQQQQLQESNERQQQQLQELHVLIEGVRQDNQQLHEITRRNQEMETTIQRQDEEIYHLRSQIENPQWVIEGDEIQMTEEVIGIGGWGEVKVGVFRGTRVAVKCLHRLILCQFNLALFSREMDIASRICHPNLLQFIGATRVGNPMILAELMPTSLREEMTIKPLTRPQILSISRDIASALNYLHLRRPEAILHRD